MSNDFDFGLSDLLDEETSTGKNVAVGLTYVLIIVYFLLSGLTTYQFFDTYAASLGAWAGPDLAGVISGIAGVVLLDFATLAWGAVRARACSTAVQMHVALAISVLTLVLSIATSMLYVILSTTLEAGVYDASGRLTQAGEMANYFGVLVIVVSLAANFFAVYLFQNKSAAVEKAAQQTAIKARVRAGQHLVNERRAKMVIDRTLSDIHAQMPSVANAMATQNTGQYFENALPSSVLGGRSGDGFYGIDQLPLTPSTDADVMLIEVSPGVYRKLERTHTGDADAVSPQTPAPPQAPASAYYAQGVGVRPVPVDDGSQPEEATVEMPPFMGSKK